MYSIGVPALCRSRIPSTSCCLRSSFTSFRLPCILLLHIVTCSSCQDRKYNVALSRAHVSCTRRLLESEVSISQLIDEQLDSDACILYDWRSSGPEHGSRNHADSVDKDGMLRVENDLLVGVDHC